ncbi:MAG TPA: hypothetical protein VFY13_06120 [Luteolibacter sp.]|nr:hypothetical protein [Luteolibacter sp.]
MEPEHQPKPQDAVQSGEPGVPEHAAAPQHLEEDLWGFEAPAGGAEEPPASRAATPASAALPPVEPRPARFNKFIHTAKPTPPPAEQQQLSLEEPAADWRARLDDSFAPLEDFAPLEPVSEPVSDPVSDPFSAPLAESLPPLPVAPIEVPAAPREPADDFTSLEDPWVLDDAPLAHPQHEGLLHELNGGWWHWLRSVGRRIAGFSMIEQAAWIALMLLLGGFSALAFLPAMNQLPKQREALSSDDFPIQGERVGVLAADTAWRPPVTEGPDADTCRRGTLLLPMVDLELEAKTPSAIRVIFRDQNGVGVGDPVSRAIAAGTQKLSLAGTAGFDQPGMFAAYRTGEAKPWTVQVYEAASVDAGADEVRLLFELPISPRKH